MPGDASPHQKQITESQAVMPRESRASSNHRVMALRPDRKQFGYWIGRFPGDDTSLKPLSRSGLSW